MELNIYLFNTYNKEKYYTLKIFNKQLNNPISVDKQLSRADDMDLELEPPLKDKQL